MKQVFRVFWGCTLAAALALTGCGRGGAPGSSGAGSMSGSGSGAMSGGTAGQEQAWRTGLGVVTEAAGSDRAGKITTAAAAVVLDADGKLADVMLDELELSVSGGSTGSVTTPEDVQSKRTKGEDYPLAAASSLGKGWAEQADWFADYLTGRTSDEVKKLKTDENGKPQDADLVSGCTIAVDQYRVIFFLKTVRLKKDVFDFIAQTSHFINKNFFQCKRQNVHNSQMVSLCLDGCRNLPGISLDNHCIYTPGI